MSFWQEEINDDVSLMRDVVRVAVRAVLYHEKGLKETASTLALMRELLVRAGITINDDAEAVEQYEDDEDGSRCNTVNQYASILLGRVLDLQQHHEESLVKEHKKLAAAKALLLRFSPPLPFTFAEVEAEIRQWNADKQATASRRS